MKTVFPEATFPAPPPNNQLRAILAFIVLALALSCSTHDPLHIRFDDDVSFESRRRITEGAFSSWNDVTLEDRQFTLAPASDPRDRVTRISITADLPVGLDGRECTWEGFECGEADWIRIRAGLGPARELDVARHELGHALGMKHTRPDEIAVMTSDTKSSTITAADLRVCLEADACGSIQLAPLP